MNKMDKKELLKKVIDAIQNVADTLKIHPIEVTKSLLISNSDVTDWDIRLVGSLDLIKKSRFPITNKQLSDIKEQKDIKEYIHELETKLSEKTLTEEKVLEAIEKNITPVKIKSYKSKTTNKPKLVRDIVAVLTDTHYGLIVNKEEVNNVNQYGWMEASRRTAYFIQQICEYKLNRRDEVQNLHLVINGDILCGSIHGLKDRTAELMIFQVNGAIHILSHAIARLSENFKNVVVHAQAGNHEDLAHRREGNHRVHAQKYDNYANMVYFALSAIFKDTPNVSFNMNKSLQLDFNTPAGRVLVAHGDILFGKELGNVGAKINTKGLGDAIRRYNAGEISRSKDPIKMLILGHCHSSAHFITDDGVEVCIVPSLSGTDPFAFSLNFNSSITRQLIFESTADFMFGDSRNIQVDLADNMDYLDEIIPIFQNELKWSK